MPDSRIQDHALVEQNWNKEYCQLNAFHEFWFYLDKGNGYHYNEMDDEPAYQIRDKALICDIFIRQIHDKISC